MNKELEAEKRTQRLVDDIDEARNRGMSYGQLQAERYKKRVNIAELRNTTVKEREDMPRTKAVKKEEVAPVQSDPMEIQAPPEPKIPMAVKAFVSVRISELEKELAELKEFKAGYSKCV